MFTFIFVILIIIFIASLIAWPKQTLVISIAAIIIAAFAAANYLVDHDREQFACSFMPDGPNGDIDPPDFKSMSLCQLEYYKDHLAH